MKKLYLVGLFAVLSLRMAFVLADEVDVFAEALSTIKQEELSEKESGKTKEEKLEWKTVDVVFESEQEKKQFPGRERSKEPKEEERVDKESLLKAAQSRMNRIKNWDVSNLLDNQQNLANILKMMTLSDGKQNYQEYKKLALDLVGKIKKGEFDFEIAYGQNGTHTSTPLLMAVEARDAELVSALLQKGADPLKVTKNFNITEDTTEERQWTPLVRALYNFLLEDSNEESIILDLIKHAASDQIDTILLDATTLNKTKKTIQRNIVTPLLVAVKNNNTVAVKALLEKGSDPLKKTITMDENNKDEQTPLEVALDKREGNESWQTMVLDLINAIKNNINEIITQTHGNMQTGYDLWPHTHLLLAIRTKDKSIVEALLNKGAKVFYTNPLRRTSSTLNYEYQPLTTALHQIWYNKNVALSLIEKTKNSAEVDFVIKETTFKDDGTINTNEKSPLTLAIERKSLEILHKLLEKGANPFKMIQRGDIEISPLYVMLNSYSIKDFKDAILNIAKNITRYKDSDQKPITEDTILYYKDFKNNKTLKNMINQIEDVSTRNEIKKAFNDALKKD